MLFNLKEGFVDKKEFHSFTNNSASCYYSGIMFFRGRKEGADSASYLIDFFTKTGEIPFKELHGAFCCIITNKDGESIFFTDNNNLRCFFYTDEVIGTKFLQIIPYVRDADFDTEAVCELLNLGNVYFGKTLIKSIYLTTSESYYIYKNNHLVEMDKGLDDIDGETPIKNSEDFISFFDDIAYALLDKRVTNSLTGGFDSRLVFACLKDTIKLAPFYSGDNDKHLDAICAGSVAKAGGYQLDRIKTVKPVITEGYLRELFIDAQGLVVSANDGYIRINDFMKNRQNSNFNCYITGDGGVMHKDWWWMQDLPFYRKKSTNLSKFYNQRIAFINCNLPFKGKMSELSIGLKERFMNSSKKYLKRLNTQSYDSLYFNLNGRKTAVHYNNCAQFVESYAPLWERELVQYSYHLPRRKRFMTKSMREITTLRSIEIARVPTVQGTTASSELLYLIRDYLFQSRVYAKKVIRMLGRVFIGKSMFVGGAITWSVEDEIRFLAITQQALDYCILRGWFSENAMLKDIRFDDLGRILQIYMLSEVIRDARNPK